VKCKVASHGLFCFKGFLVEDLSEIDLTTIAELKKKKVLFKIYIYHNIHFIPLLDLNLGCLQVNSTE